MGLYDLGGVRQSPRYLQVLAKPTLRYPDKGEGGGSSPPRPTMKSTTLLSIRSKPLQTMATSAESVLQPSGLLRVSRKTIGAKETLHTKHAHSTVTVAEVVAVIAPLEPVTVTV